MDKSKTTFVRIIHFVCILTELLAENAEKLADLVFGDPTQQSGSNKGERNG